MVRADTPVFVIDDDASVRKSLGRLLRSAGHSVETFSSAAEFLDCGHCDIAGCLVLDVRMPGTDGLELQERLAASSQHLPIVFITAHDDTQTKEQAMKAGAVAFLIKPFDESKLLGAIEQAFGRNSTGNSRND